MSNYRNDLAYVCQRNLNHSTSFSQTILIKQQGINLLDQNHLFFHGFMGYISMIVFILKILNAFKT